jgi:catechol 2,3-dioxygenase-like lactoylglutathione lyase family enzyme
MIVCSSMPTAREWYETVVGLTAGHGGDEYEMMTSDGVPGLQQHKLEAHEHPHLLDVDDASRGNGVSLWFETTEYDAVLARIGKTGPSVAVESHVNPLAQHREIWLHDPDGYLVIINSPYNDLG